MKSHNIYPKANTLHLYKLIYNHPLSPAAWEGLALYLTAWAINYMPGQFSDTLVLCRVQTPRISYNIIQSRPRYYCSRGECAR